MAAAPIDMNLPFHLQSLANAAVTFSVTFLVVSQAGCVPEKSAKNPEEVGSVVWERDYDMAMNASGKSGKPVFLLFQEVPGCAGCKQFGRDVLGDPKVVKAIETNFIPLLVHNNKSGADAGILRKYNEPAWNYQVVRFLGPDGHDLIPRKDRVWESKELLQRMNQALRKAGRPQVTVSATRRVAISQSCFWTGEMKIGGIDGVRRTEAGYLDGREVTLVDYDPAEVSLEELTRQARNKGVATGVYTDWEKGYRKAPESDQKRQLQGTRYAKLHLTPEQATRVNAFARTDAAKADSYLTDR